MTTTASGNALEQRYLANMAVIDALKRYALSGEVSPLLSDRFAQQLQSPESQALVARWLRTFRQTLELLNAFRDDYVRGVAYDEDDLEQVTEASDRALNALTRRLAGPH